ncbi:MAG: hypothetical protein Q9168_000188 [Polycauliona sp. 1 TL-2023]
MDGHNDAKDRDPTYHTSDANYVLPNDNIEHARLEDQAAGLNDMMDNRIIHAPLKAPSQIIDVGCGTGIVTRQLAAAYPTAHVYGIDLSPVPTLSDSGSRDPPNVEFLLGDVRASNSKLLPSSTDFIYSRLLIMGMTDWPGYVRDLVSLLRPGGWVEMQDFSLDWYLNGARCSQDWQWLEALFLAARQKGLDLRGGKNVQTYMRQAGLVDISVMEYRVPMGNWMKKPEKERIGKHAATEYGPMFYHAIPKMLQGLGYSEEKLEEFQSRCTVDLEGSEGKEIIFYATIGRKP